MSDWSQPGGEGDRPSPPPPPGSGPPPPPPPQQPPPAWGQQPGWGQQPAWGQGWGAYAAAAKPGIIPLRPLGLGEILDGAFSAVRFAPKATLGLSAIVISTSSLLSFAVRASAQLNATGYRRGSVFANGGLTTAWVAATVLTAIAGFVLAGMLTVVMAEAVLGRQIGLGETWARVRPRFWALIGASLIAGIGPYLGLIACVIPGIFLWGALALTTPALVLERVGVGQALRRSWRLAVPSWWRVWGIRALTTIMAGVLSSIIVIPFVIAGGVSSGLFSRPESYNGGGILSLFLSTVGGTVAGVITAPFVAGVLALLYIDRRMRVEGLDVQLAQAAAAGAG